MPARSPLELNEPQRRRPGWSEYRQYLLNASNELYLHELLCTKHGLECPPGLVRAHESIRRELRRLDEEAASAQSAEAAEVQALVDPPGEGGGPDA